MTKAVKCAIGFAAIACAAAFILTGCTGSSTKKTESTAAKEEEDKVVPISEETNLDDVVAAPEEGDDVDQGREGRPTDSWNADAPAPSEEKTEDGGEAKDGEEAEENTAESFAVADSADDEAATRAE